MIPLTTPLALIGLLSVPILVAIYLFHRRPRTKRVSSLMLWATLKQPRSGGRQTEPPRFPLTFWLELAILLLLVAAAAHPTIPAPSRRRPLVIILDDSLSMAAGRGTDTAQRRAMESITREISTGAYDPIRIILAGSTPLLAGPVVTSPSEARSQMGKWLCTAASADIDAALALAAQVGEPNALILVASDRGPARKMGPRVRWNAFGRPEPNAAFLAASRSSIADRDRVSLEVGCFCREPIRTSVAIASGGNLLHRESISLSPNDRRSIVLDLPPGAETIEARLDDDAAAFDNRVILIPERRPAVRVGIEVGDELLRDEVQRAVAATEHARVGSGSPELIITDGPATTTAGPWTLHVIVAQAGVSHAGPFLIDRAHPLVAGLNLDAVLWTAAKTPLPGSPVILAGNQPLLTDERAGAEGHTIHMALNPALSNLQKSPAWPALIWNLIEWRSSERRGFPVANITIGSSAGLSIGSESRSIRITAPNGETRTVSPPLGARVMPIMASQPGVWTAVAGTESYRFASNALVPQESDLSGARSGTESRWTADALTSGGHIDVAPLLLLLALAVAAAHQRIAFEAAPA
jgi:aerotolerance regulator-like protein